VSGIDMGTLRDRLLDLRGVIVGKTGTFGSEGASALVGMLRTRKYGEVVFAVLNYWLPVPEARHRQDAFVRALVAATGAEPWPYERHAPPDFRAATVE
jgi:D-alanyl-D-alanine carboxypeptidase